VAYLGFGKEGAWRARRARAYNGGLGAEPPAGFRGRAPGGGSGGEAPWSWNTFCFWTFNGSRKIAHFFWNLKTQKITASYQMQSHMAILIAYFIGMKKTIKHCCILQFLLENGKKRTFSYKVACKKNFMLGPKGGIAPCPPLNTPLLTCHLTCCIRACNICMVQPQAPLSECLWIYCL